MLMPYGTDATVYHYPVATVVIIAINVVLFIATGMGCNGDAIWLILEFDRINPLQWVTAAFMHASWTHLISNMIFLWSLGIVLEGKLGLVRFSGLYLGLALTDGAIGQIPMFLLTDGEGGALGASGVIFALIAVAMIWAPLTELHFLYVWSWFWIGTVDIPIFAVALFYGALQFLQLWFVGFGMSTPMLHLLGLTVGFPFAIAMLKLDLVDCDGGDLFTRIGLPLDRFGLPKFAISGAAGARQELTGDAVAPSPSLEAAAGIRAASTGSSKSAAGERDPCADAVGRFARAVAAQNAKQAVTCFQILRSRRWAAALSDAMLVSYINLLSTCGRQRDSLIPLQYLVARRSSCACEARLRIAKIHLKFHSDPASAIRVLTEPPVTTSQRLRKQRQNILKIARARLASATANGATKRSRAD